MRIYSWVKIIPGLEFNSPNRGELLIIQMPKQQKVFFL
ncbi:Hypothetical protein Minf_2007 [Methylacidiphilum infernorum V4]|uniref:Uncharacterized protein n=1 Tax=Methylacidiphilum infernorum (isolate V4) TaxID=481448 RepID=B3DYL3_METI4|nr:Hypothetical protein Minf_2007 [Methylacidiphilum infernorum V4]